jgi:hypothetical protein
VYSCEVSFEFNRHRVHCERDLVDDRRDRGAARTRPRSWSKREFWPVLNHRPCLFHLLVRPNAPAVPRADRFFSSRLEPFLAALPHGFRYGIEIRNREYLKPGYFALLVYGRQTPRVRALAKQQRSATVAARPAMYVFPGE